MRDQVNIREQNQEVEIDLLEVAQVLLQKIWIILLAALICGLGGFAYARFMITPLYESSVLVYVNNSSFSVGSTSFSLSSSEISAAKSLVDVYSIILKTRRTLNDVIEEAALPYTYDELYNMIDTSDVDSTEIFRVTVTDADPDEAALIANTIADILPDKIAEIVDGSSVRIVDSAVVPTKKSSPSISKYTEIGAAIGFVVACAAVVVIYLLDDTIRSDEYILQTYDVPVLSSIPSFGMSGKKGYYKRYGYGNYGSYAHSASAGTAGENIDNNIDNVD